ncbi:Ocs element-binding factor 1-like protein [Drosera capensis]
MPSTSVLEPTARSTEVERRKRKMESNRESARRSRLRKQQHIEDLIKEIARLERENEEWGRRIDELERMCGSVEAENAVLRSEKQRLRAELAVLLEAAATKTGKDGVVVEEKAWRFDGWPSVGFIGTLINSRSKRFE